MSKISIRNLVQVHLLFLLPPLVLLLSIQSACRTGDSTDSISVDSISAFQDTLAKWEQYMESSAQGSWQTSTEHRVEVVRLRTFGGEEYTEPPFFNPAFVDISGDTLIISDKANDTVVCMDTTGIVLWRYGGQGEGPGYILGIGSVSIGDSLIAVVNSGQSYVDLISRGGQFVRRLSSVNNPQNALFLQDGRLVVFSKRHPGGDAHIVDFVADSVLYSFGDGQWEPENAREISVFDIWASEFPPFHLAYLCQYECKLVVCDLRDFSWITVPTRATPFDVTPAEISTDGSEMYGTFYPIIGSLFEGPEGEICIGYHTIKGDGTMIGSGTPTERRAPVTPVDRYSLSGEYLDTFILPDSVITRTNHEQEQYASVQGLEGRVILYRLSTII